MKLDMSGFSLFDPLGTIYITFMLFNIYVNFILLKRIAQAKAPVRSSGFASRRRFIITFPGHTGSSTKDNEGD